MELSAGFILKDRYIIQGLLGQGGMGTVYLAKDTALDQLVAVKSNLNPVDEGIRQFESEARLLAKLRHQNLPLVFDHFILDDVQYLVMDYIPGENLNERLKDEGPQSIEKVLEWAKQITAALNYLHNQDPPIIHRDIKPANIKITPEGQIVLVDFGIAKSSSEQTTVGTRGYTPGYAPPEQYSHATTGPFSDQYSFAATLYALLTGGPPPESVDLMLGHQTLAPTRSYSKNIPIHLDEALQRAMSVRPDQRFTSVTQFFNALTDPAAMADYTVMPGTDTVFSESNLPESDSTSSAVQTEWFQWVVGVFIVGLIGISGVMLSNLLNGGTLLENNFQVEVALASSATPLPVMTQTFTPSPTLEPTPVPTLQPTTTSVPSPEPTPFGGAGKIIFVSNRNGRYQIFSMNPDGSDVTQLTFDDTDKSWPMWSPDGTRIAYVANGGLGPYNTPLGQDIWVMNADGSDSINLTQTRGVDEDPVWSPDGTKIVFVTERFGGSKVLAVMDSDGSNQKQVSFHFSEFNPTFSPDGLALLFASTNRSTLSIRTYDPDNSPEKVEDLFDRDNKARIYDVRFLEPDRMGMGEQPSWSPDGKWIVFIRTSGDNRRIYLMEVASEGATVRHLDVPGFSFDPAWSPDSYWIAFSNVPNTIERNQEIFTMDLGGRFQTNITNHPADDKMPSWQPLP